MQLEQIRAAKSALTPPEWSKRQQGHRAGVPRPRYPKEKTAILMQRYQVSKYISRKEIVTLADETGLTAQQVD
jgi:hypothetical protein